MIPCTPEELLQYVQTKQDVLRDILAFIAEHSYGHVSITWRCEFGDVTMTIGRRSIIDNNDNETTEDSTPSGND